MLWVAVLLPTLPLDVFARASADAHVAHPFVVSSGGHYPRVAAANDAARAAAIAVGQLVSAALALAPDVVIRDRDAASEEAALREVATLALAFTPNASIAPPDALVAEIGTSVRLFGGVRPLVERLIAETRARGYVARVALAPTPTAALLLARAGATHDVLDVAELPAALASLPLSRLDLDADTLAMLAAAGITTFGAANALPRAALARRFGTALVATLDRALARAPDARDPYRPPPHFARKLVLPALVDEVAALQFAVNRLVDEFAVWLLARGLGATRLSLTLIHERHVRERGIASTRAPFALGAPARAREHLSAVLRERLARIELPAPVEAIVLDGDETAPLAGRNLGLLPEDEAASAAVPLVERLRSRLGDDAVVTLAPQAEHRPEYATTEALAGNAIAASANARTSDGRAKRDRRSQASRAPPATGPDPRLPPRPIWLLDEAEALGGALEAKPWILRDGPERIESGWWDGRDFRRDYFVAETPHGEVVWIYRDHRYGTDDGEWHLHGYFA